MKFDIAILNPPYKGGLYEKFLELIFGITSESGKICWVSPSTWLIGKKQNKKITSKLEKYYTEIYELDPGQYFDISMAQSMSTVYINKCINENKILYNGKEYIRCSDITKFSNDDLLVSVFNKIGCSTLQDHIGAHVYRSPDTFEFNPSTVITEPDPEWWCLKLTAFSPSNTVYDDNFYKVISKYADYETICGQYKDLSQKEKRLKYYIAFETENELKNFYDYLRTDFARICLYFIKTNLNLGRGELKYIPWQDFTESWDDRKLFSKYSITEEEIKHIYDILPNYYNIERMY